jgi:DNA primase
VFCFDKDTAGYKAAWRALEVSLDLVSDQKTIGFLFMPGTQDPDEYVRESGPEAFMKFANQPKALSELLVSELGRRTNPATAEGRAKLLHEARPLVARVQAPLLQLAIVKELAKRTGFSQVEVEAACGVKRPSTWRLGARAAFAAVPRRAPPSISRTLLKIVLQKPGWAAGLPVEQLPEEAEGTALRALCTAVDQGELPAGGLGTVLEYFRGGEHEPLFDEILGELAAENFDEGAMEAVFNDSLGRLRHLHLRQEIDVLNAKARASGLSREEEQRLAQLLSQKHRLIDSVRVKDL